MELDFSKEYPPVDEISDEALEAMLRKTVLSLPDDPSAAGMKADTIKKRFWAATFGESFSVIAEIQRLIKQINAALATLGESRVEVKTEIKVLEASADPSFELQMQDDDGVKTITWSIGIPVERGLQQAMTAANERISQNEDSIRNNYNDMLSKFSTLENNTNGKISDNARSIQAYYEELISKLNAFKKETNNALEFIREGTTTEEIDSIRELVDYVNEHGSTTAQMQQNIQQNAQSIEALDEKSKQLEETLVANEAADAELKEKVERDINHRFNTLAGALTGEGDGTAVMFNDVSSVPHTVSCRVYGNNLVPYPYLKTSETNNGVSYTVRDDGGIEVSGATGDTASGFNLYQKDMLLPAGTYTVGGSTDTVQVAVRYLVDGADTSFNSKSMNTRTVSEPFVINRISLYVAKNTTVPEGTVIYPTMCTGGTAMENYEKSGSGTVRTCGKNLLDVSGASVKIGSTSNYGVDITGMARTLQGNACLSITLKSGKTVPTDCRFGLVYDRVKEDGAVENYGEWMVTDSSIKKTYLKIPTSWNSFIGVGAYLQSGWDTVRDAFDIQLEVGTSPTEYEPYKEGETITVELPAVLELSSIAPSMSVIGENGLLLHAKYNRDVNIALERIEQAIISLGGNV